MMNLLIRFCTKVAILLYVKSFEARDLEEIERARKDQSAITVEREPSASPKGIKVVYDLSKDEGSRVTSLQVRCSECLIPEYAEYDEDAVYKIAINSFLVTGGDGYSVITDNMISHKVGRVDIDILVEYLAAKSPIYQEIEGRITFEGETRAEMKYTDLV